MYITFQTDNFKSLEWLWHLQSMKNSWLSWAFFLHKESIVPVTKRCLVTLCKHLSFWAWVTFFVRLGYHTLLNSNDHVLSVHYISSSKCAKCFICGISLNHSENPMEYVLLSKPPILKMKNQFQREDMLSKVVHLIRDRARMSIQGVQCHAWSKVTAIIQYADKFFCLTN